MSNMRIVKYETMIEDINTSIAKEERNVVSNVFRALNNAISQIECEVVSEVASNVACAIDRWKRNTPLALIYDYDKCNEYAKVIMNKSELVLNKSDNSGLDCWRNDYPTSEKFEDGKRRIEASKRFIQLCRNTINATEGYKFIFWALMILTVDKTDAEEHLALICDFAKMLRITDDEFEDIIQIIKIIYNEVTSEYLFKSENIPSVFGSLLNIYAGQVID